MATDEAYWKLLRRASGDIASTIPFFMFFDDAFVYEKFFRMVFKLARVRSSDDPVGSNLPNGEASGGKA